MVPDSAQKNSRSTFQRNRLKLDPQTAEQVVSEEDLESFRFEVTAGKKLRIDGDLHPANGQRLRLNQSHPSGPQISTSTPEESQSTASIPRIQVAEARFSQPSRKKLPSWVASLFLHLIAILGLAFFTFSTFEQQVDFTLSMEPKDFPAEEIVLQEIVLDPLDEIESDVKQLASELQEASKVTASELSAEVALADLPSLSGSANLGLGELSGLFGTHGNALSEMLPTKEKLTATFFDTKLEGRRIVYIVDNSGGMQNGELETLIDELLRSVDSLTTEQEFYVIFYSDSLYPLLYPDPVQRFVPANDRFKRQLTQWLETVEFCLGNSVDQAIRAAEAIRPDAVCLLTDGNVKSTPSGRKLAVLLDSQNRRFPIHTFGIGMKKSHKAAANLKLVAEANKGTFHTVEVSAVAKERAKQNKRPYHNKEPGKVWGLNVGLGWGKK